MTDQDPNVEPEETPEETEETPDVARLSREAASYRVKLRETEVERDTLGATVERYHVAEVERLAATRLETASDLWLVREDVAGLLNDEGIVDPEKVGDLLDTVLEQHPAWARREKRPPQRYPVEMLRDPNVPDNAETWDDALRQSTHGKPVAP